MINKNDLMNMETIENNMVYGDLKIDTDKMRVYISDENIVTVEEYINGYEENFWEVIKQY